MKRCEVCGEPESAALGRMVAPCLCHKKSDDHGYYHRACFESLLGTRDDENPDATPATATCQRCGGPFRVEVEQTFVADAAHVCRVRSLSHLCEVRGVGARAGHGGRAQWDADAARAQMLMLLVVLGCFVFAVRVLALGRQHETELLHRRQQALQEHDSATLAAIAAERAAHGYRDVYGGDMDERSWTMLGVMFFLTGVFAVATIWRVCQRFRTAASDVKLRSVKAT
jgi:hypothetical protein